LIEGAELWGETSVHAENFLIDDGSDGEAVETVSEGFPELNVVSPLALVVETIDTINRSTLVVPSEEEEVLWVLNLVG
jgi:hypothetical protein